MVAAGILLGTGFPAFATDNFPGTTISGTGSLTGTNTGATGEAGEPTTFGGGALETIWYSWTAPATGRAVFATCNQTGNTFTNFDTTLNVYTGNAVNALAAVTSNDDTTGCSSTAGGNLGSSVQFNAVSGTTYRIQVDGYASADGNYNLHYGMVGIVVAVTDNLAVEGGGTAAFTIRLATPPRSNATVSIGTSTQCTRSPTTLTFTNANWATPQTVTITAIDDAVVEGIHSCAQASITAAGGAYAGISATPPTITIYDNDVASFTIAKTVNLANVATTATLNFTVTVTNTSGVNMTGTSFVDALTQGGSPRTLTSGPTLSGDNAPIGTFNVGEVWVYAATYAVTQSDLDNGANLLNTATFDTAQTAPSSATSTTTITQSPSLVVTKTADDTTDVPAGQTLTYTYVVTNNGNITIDNVTLAESHNGSGPPPAPSGETLSGDIAPLGDSTDATANNGAWSTLAPGDSVTFTGSYLVTQADIDTL